MEHLENIPLSQYTTFFIGGIARHFIIAHSTDEVVEALSFAKSLGLPTLIFSGGSNMLVSENGYDGVVVKIETKGFKVLQEDQYSVTLNVASGEVWDEVVKYAVGNEWWGIENLSHIPGLTGSFCVQNVGAYGQEASGVVESVELLDRTTMEVLTFNKTQLNFGYRSSIFNTIHKGRYVILSTTLKLSKIPKPNLTYGDVAKYFSEKNIGEPKITEIREAIIEIRDRKFPYPRQSRQGNSGSFFRGPLLSKAEFSEMINKISEGFGLDAAAKLEAMRDRLEVPQGYKTPAAYLIELCGQKEARFGGAKINFSQPAVIINYTGKATSSDVLFLYKIVASEVYVRTGVWLGIEPELIGFTGEELSSFNIKDSRDIIEMKG